MSRGEKAAIALLTRLGIDSAPIPVEEIARDLGIIITKERLAADLSGLLIRQPRATPVIGVNTLHHPRRQRFSIAHELGHNELNHKGEVIVDSGIRVNKRDPKSQTASDADEREANAFAAALLMPANQVQDAVAEMLPERPGQGRIVNALALKFNVSEEAMHYRLLNLGIFSH